MIRDKNYYLFLFLESFTRGLVDVFSLVLLYEKGFSIGNIYVFLLFKYLFGIISCYFSIRYSYKFILIVSSLLYGCSYIYLNYMDVNIFSLIIFSLLLSFSDNSYHFVRHLLAITKVSNKKNSNIILFIYLGVVISSIIGIYIISKSSFLLVSVIIFILSIISIIPIVGFRENKDCLLNNYFKVKIDRNKYLYSILGQFKVILMELQPLYIYLYINNSIIYVGIFNVIFGVSSLMIVWFILSKFSFSKYKYWTCLLGCILFFKINIYSKYVLLFIAFVEGILIKIYDTISLNNLYDVGTTYVREYLLKEEFIFFGTKIVIMGLIILFNLDIKIIIYICIIGISSSGFFVNNGS